MQEFASVTVCLAHHYSFSAFYNYLFQILSTYDFGVKRWQDAVVIQPDILPIAGRWQSYNLFYVSRSFHYRPQSSLSVMEQ